MKFCFDTIHPTEQPNMTEPSNSESVAKTSNKIAEIQTKHSQIVRVLAKPIRNPSNGDTVFAETLTSTSWNFFEG